VKLHQSVSHEWLGLADMDLSAGYRLAIFIHDDSCDAAAILGESGGTR